jgi:choline dehydrogenase
MGQFTVIVGAGSAGSALAARLTEDPAHEVLLIEAGPDYPTRAEVPPSIANPYDLAEDHDWGLPAFFVEPSESREPVRYPRGKVVGGSSCVNASFAGRGTPADFATWVEAGNDRWGWDDVAPYFVRLENDLQFGDRPGHSRGGPVTVTRVARELWPSGMSAFERAAIEAGFAAAPDYNDPETTGVSPAPRNQDGEDQANGLLTYIAEARERPNLTIRPDTRVRRLEFDEATVTGVEVDGPAGRETIAADRVVLCAGAIHTPHILALSGIGPAATLARIGVEPVSVREGVGRNLQDHPLALVFCVLKAVEPGRRFGSLAMLRTSSSPDRVNDLMLFPAVLEPTALLQDDVDLGDAKALAIATQVAKATSLGWLDFRSADPDVMPEIHLNMLGDREDMERMKQAVRLSYELATSAAMSEHITEILFPDAATVEDDAALEAWLKGAVSTGYHAVGTCRMGPAEDPASVVDQDLAVIGVEGLWVADASIMPTITAGLTNLTAFMIGERMADLLPAAEVS